MPGSHVDVWIELLHPHAETAPFQQHPNRSARQALTKRTDNSTSNEDVLGQNCETSMRRGNVTELVVSRNPVRQTGRRSQLGAANVFFPAQGGLSSRGIERPTHRTSVGWRAIIY